MFTELTDTIIISQKEKHKNDGIPIKNVLFPMNLLLTLWTEVKAKKNADDC